MQLPSSVRWIEIDLPPLFQYEERILKGERPVCRLEQFPLDIADAPARRRVFEQLGRSSKRALIISEGLLIYLTADEVCALGRDLAAQPTLQRWATDLVSPRLLRMLQRQVGTPLAQAGSPLRFAPEKGSAFFEDCGWRAIDVRSMLQTAAKLNRLSWLLRLFARLPDTKGTNPKPIWGGVILLDKLVPSPSTGPA
jgi:O-methyltransferase involved in polyketide biosynthesis